MAPVSFNQSWPVVACILCLVASLPHATIAQTDCGTLTCSEGESCCNNQCCPFTAGPVRRSAILSPPDCCNGVCCADQPAQLCANVYPTAGTEEVEICCPESRVFVFRYLPSIRYCCPHDLCGSNYCCIDPYVCTRSGCVPVGVVVGDPHVSLPGLVPPNQTDVTDFTFDFHGSAGKAYCMITNAAITVNAHMFSLAPTALVPEHRYHGGRCFQFTWIDGIGFVHRNLQGRTQRIAVWLDRTLTDVTVHPFNVTFEDEPVESKDAAWTSPDGIAKIGRTAVSDQLVVSLDGLLEVEISRAEDAELRDQPEGPPVRYINLAVKGLAVGPGVHGFMGQMYAPGAVEARLKMATQAGLNHREYVEGADEDYQTSDLTSADCSFDRFSTAVQPEGPGLISASRKLRSSAPQKKESLACSYSGTSFVCK